METDRFDSQALSDRSLIDLTLYAVLFGPNRRSIRRYHVRLIVGYPELSIQPVDEVDNSFHDLPISPGHGEWNFTTKNLR